MWSKENTLTSNLCILISVNKIMLPILWEVRNDHSSQLSSYTEVNYLSFNFVIFKFFYFIDGMTALF